MRDQIVLLVDQDPSVAEAIALALGGGKFSFLFAQNFQEAIRILGEHGEDLSLVITDIEPRGPGLALLVAIKTYRDDLPVVVLTSLADPSINAAARSRGAARLLRKPISFTELRNVVRDIYEEEERPAGPSEDSAGRGLPKPAAHEVPAGS
ncbi:MAG: response regulator [Verrucomicrobia bacterium]|nr:response regulator [Verrucomicrobiota bacterium]